MQSTFSASQTLHPPTTHFKDVLLWKNPAHPTAYTHRGAGQDVLKVLCQFTILSLSQPLPLTYMCLQL